MNELILASTSPYRIELLKKMGVNFTAVKPLCNEELLKTELLKQKSTPVEIAEKLAFEKANSIRSTHKQAIIIGGDQVVDFNGKIVGKSLSAEAAFEQLTQFSGKTHHLITSVVVVHQEKTWALNHISAMKMKKLSKNEILNYINKDNPIDCAGSYKIEKSGICLFEKIESDDFTAIQGLPMMWLSQILKEIGYELFNK